MLTVCSSPVQTPIHTVAPTWHYAVYRIADPGVMHIPSHAPFAACHCRSVCGSIDVVDGSAAAKLQQMAHELAASQQGKNASLVWNRALLHQLAAQAYCQAGMHSLYYTLNFLNLTAVMVLR